MNHPVLAMTTVAVRPLQAVGHTLWPVNVCDGGTSCTLNTRYDGMALPLDILSLAHYPKTVVLVAYD